MFKILFNILLVLSYFDLFYKGNTFIFYSNFLIKILVKKEQTTFNRNTSFKLKIIKLTNC